MTSNLTLKDVALLAGVSEMTASRALRDANDVSINTRKKVMDAAASITFFLVLIDTSLASRNARDAVISLTPANKATSFNVKLEVMYIVLYFSLKMSRKNF